MLGVILCVISLAPLGRAVPRHSALNPPVAEQPVDGVPFFRNEPTYAAPPDTEWTLHKTADGAHPDGNEQKMIWLMNRARSLPSSEGSFLLESQRDSVP